MNNNPTIIPVASGKGGVGKSFLTANLAIALSERGKSTIAVDMDLGGCNLHTFLELPNRFPGIGCYLQDQAAELDELLLATQLPGLKFLPGDGKTPFMANISFAQKTKLISKIKTLKADYVLLDLGAGTSFNTLDYFGISSWGLVVITPEYTSVMGMLAFLKNYLFRSVQRKLSHNNYISTMLRDIFKQSMENQVPNIKKLHEMISKEDKEAGEEAAEVIKSCRPRVIFNMGTHPDDSKMASSISKTFGNILSIEADYFGFVFFDQYVRKSIRKRTLFLTNYRESMAADNIVRIADRIVKYWNRPVKESARLLQNHVRSVFESRG